MTPVPAQSWTPSIRFQNIVITLLLSVALMLHVSNNKRHGVGAHLLGSERPLYASRHVPPPRTTMFISLRDVLQEKVMTRRMRNTDLSQFDEPSHLSPGNIPTKGQWCTPQQLRSVLVPISNTSVSQQPLRRYDRSCGTIGKSYRCKSSAGYTAFLADPANRQLPMAAQDGRCKFFVNSGDYPYPPGSNILFWGNSHMREVIHSITCQYGSAKKSTVGTAQDSACRVEDYIIVPEQDEILFATQYDNNSTVYGACNCGLMYDRQNSLSTISQLLKMDIRRLTHVVANPANVAKWAVEWKYTKCTDELWVNQLQNLTSEELFEWHPFASPKELGEALHAEGFRGKIIWTLPFWCMSKRGANRYHYGMSANFLEDNSYADAVIDFSEYICPNKQFRCDTAGCGKGNAGSHQCLPGPPDDVANVLLHLLWTM
eukprot:m.269146 g.269146  ORF g.269146 m.269146 type:complete len:429 (+) comp82501_c0_seq1:447-1733(+)